MRRLIIMTLVATSAVALTGCPGVAGNTNTNTRANTNTNVANNTIIVTNANNTNTVSTTNSNSWNANITKEDYEKNKEDYAKRAKDAGSTIGTGVNDGWLWTKTRAALMTTADLRESTINVDVSDEVVTLKGTVASEAQKKKAEEVAKGIGGVKSVTNQLKVAPADSVTNTGSTTDSDKKANTSNTKANK